MFSLKLVKFSFLLFYVILQTKSDSLLRKKLNKIDKLLTYPGWKNLNDVNSIEYSNRKYCLKRLIETPTYKSKCEQKVRGLTIYLGCTYAKVMNNLFSIIINCLQTSRKKSNQENGKIKGCICIEELINIVATLIIPIATLMKGAIDALDLLHRLPWANFKRAYRRPYILSPLLDRIGNIIDQLNDPIVPCDDKSIKSSSFDIVYSFSYCMIGNLKYEINRYCDIKPYDEDYLWNEWIQEYKALFRHGVRLVFFKFLTKKIKDYIKTVIKEKYFQLGFKFNPIIENTFIPTPEEIIDLDLEFNNR
ncbi:uncharacterized protein LOC126907063 [Daktulosphaira vitifoliae]|uniref:uncharacterized protein LOC126907063 n=1 Tax=Daktulosphaira vitifoliae TaxID=58002 RepID=UPI0021A98B48|nr:uncharacterized protein LOC126907063 [Daktulosphaira vitifoliae]